MREREEGESHLNLRQSCFQTERMYLWLWRQYTNCCVAVACGESWVAIRIGGSVVGNVCLAGNRKVRPIVVVEGSSSDRKYE